MVYRLIDFVLVVLKLLMLKVCGIIGITKIGFFNFSSTDRVKQNQRKIKSYSKLLNLIYQLLSKHFQPFLNSFWLLTETLALLLPVLR